MFAARGDGPALDINRVNQHISARVFIRNAVAIL